MMKIIDQVHLKYPSWSYCKITDPLRNYYGYLINRKRVRRLMQFIGIKALFPGLNLSKRCHAQCQRRDIIDP